MAIDPSNEYPGQVDSDAAYPLGKPRNDATPDDTSGTPLEKLWVADLWGWLQELLDKAGIAPSGSPDEVGASQYLDALKSIFHSKEDTPFKQVCSMIQAASGVSDESEIPLGTPNVNVGGYTIADPPGTRVEVPEAGIYKISAHGKISSTLSGSKAEFRLQLQANGSSILEFNAFRNTTSASDETNYSTEFIYEITDPPNEQLSLWAREESASAETFDSRGTFVIQRVG